MVDARRLRKQNSLSATQDRRVGSVLSVVFIRIGEVMAYVCLYAMRFALEMLWGKLRRQQRSWRTVLGETISDLCSALGATFIKIGQILSTRVDLFPRDVIAPLAKLQDHIPPFAFAYVPASIKTQTGHEIEDIFVTFEERPISSASIACVYRARLHDGQLVAVKIRRPDIVRKVRDDLRILRFMAHILARLPAMKLIPIVDMVEELGELIRQQLDLRIEAQNTQNFRALFAHDPAVHIPELHEEWCTEGILVMNFFDDLMRIDELHWDEEEVHASLKTGLRALYRMIFLDGAFHCDLHPGNMYLREGGQVVILDAGFIAHLQRDDRYQFAEFFLGISTNAGKKCARIIYDTAQNRPAVFDHEGFEREVVDLISQNAGSRAATFQVAPFAYHIFDIQRRFGLRGSNSFTMAILALLVFEGTAKQWYPQLKFQAEAQPFLLQALAQKRASAAQVLQGSE